MLTSLHKVTFKKKTVKETKLDLTETSWLPRLEPVSLPHLSHFHTGSDVMLFQVRAGWRRFIAQAVDYQQCYENKNPTTIL